MRTLAVIVLNWNRETETRTCLRRLSSWRGLHPEIWVVDNGSVGGNVRGLQEEFPGATWILSETNLGFGGGNNLALRKVSSPYALLLNNDASIGEAAVEALVDALGNHPQLLAVGPAVLDEDGARGIQTAGGRDVAWNISTHWRVDDLPTENQIGDGLFEVDYVPGTAVVLRVAALRELGYLDESYFFGGELADLCERGRRQGLRAAVLVTAEARHDTGVASAWREKLYPYYILRNRFLFVRKLRRRLLVVLVPLWTAYGLLVIVRDALRGRLREAEILRLALIVGLLGRFGNRNDRVLAVLGRRDNGR